MADSEKPLIIFDFPGPLGSLGFSLNAGEGLVFHPFPQAATLLEDLAAKARLSAVSFDSQVDQAKLTQALKVVGLSSFFEVNVWIPVPTPTALLALAAKAAAPTSRTVFVSTDARHRIAARQADFLTAPDERLIPAALAGEELTYVRVRSKGTADTTAEQISEIAGFEVLKRAMSAREPAYGIASPTAIGQLNVLGYEVCKLCTSDETAISDLFLIRSGVDDAFLKLVGQLPVVEETRDGWIIGVPGDRSIEDYHPRNGSHGHTLSLDPGGERRVRHTLTVPTVPARALMPSEIATLQTMIVGADIDREIGPLIGNRPLDVENSPIIRTRSTLCPAENRLAAHHIANRLSAILCDPVSPKSIKKGLLNVAGELPGASRQEAIVIGAHFDSIALDLGDKPPGSIAPGADDDASGVAGVLAVARALKQLAKPAPPKRSIRFALFNGEEGGGMTGSRCYTDELEKSKVSVIAMMQMDMIGYHGTATDPGRFEIHAPGTEDYENPAVIEQSKVLQRIIAKAAAAVAPTSLTAELYPEKDCPFDLAGSGSDHVQFLLNHWPACLISENFWLEKVCLKNATIKNHPHPGYHSQNDTYVCCDYAADIARVVAGAAWMIANG